jgi:murein L,D-transpeptidase YafK
MKKNISYIFLVLLASLALYYFWPENQLTPGQKIDRIVVNKEQHTMEVFFKGELLASYHVSLSKKGLAKRQKCGDNLTPEGRFHVKKRTSSAFHKAIDVGYGCDVLIHGQKYGWVGKFHRWKDCTLGCIALTNPEIDEVYDAVENGCPIEINP